jgi:hypothetical protein
MNLVSGFEIWQFPTRDIMRKKEAEMREKLTAVFLSLVLTAGLSTFVFAAKVPAPEKGDGFKAVTLKEAKKLHEDGAKMIACHSHTTDFMKGHPVGTQHITCLVPKNHKRTDLSLSEVDFDVAQLPSDKNTPIITYCASNN